MLGYDLVALKSFCEIWGEMKYFNPYIYLNNIDWNTAFIDSYEIIKESSNENFLKIIHEKMLCKINDPLIFNNENSYELEENAINSFNETDEYAILRLNDWESESAHKCIKEAILAKENKKAIIIDIRNLKGVENNYINIILYHMKFFQHFISSDLQIIPKLMIEHEGFKSERKLQNYFYKSYFKIIQNELLPKIPNSVEIPLMIICSEHDNLSDEILSLRNEKKCLIIATKDTHPNQFPSIRNFGVKGLKTHHGEFSFSYEIPIFENNKKPIYCDYLIENMSFEKILEFAKEKFKAFEIPDSDEFLNIGNSIKNDSKISKDDFPNEAERVLAITKIYTIIKYFNPHNNLMKCDWNKEFSRFISMVIACTNREEYINVIKKMTALISDSHARTLFTRKTRLSELPIKLSYVEEKIVISEISNKEFSDKLGLKIGDEISKVNNIVTNEYIEQRRKYISFSREEMLIREVMIELINNEIGEGFNFEIKSIGGNIRNINGKFGDYEVSEEYLEKQNQSLKQLENQTLYLKLFTLCEDEEAKLYELLEINKNLIIDLRGYPRYPRTQKLLRELCINDVFDWGSCKIPIVNYSRTHSPNIRTDFKFSSFKHECLNRFKKKIIVLINRETQSFAESITEALRVNSDAIIVGENSAGANGNITYINLPGDIEVRFTGMMHLLSNGETEQQVGIIPDFKVEQTLENLINGKEDYLEKAISILNL